MTKNKYIEKLLALAVFLSAHFRIIVFMSFIVFLSYIALLGIQIVSAINQTPSIDDINKRLSNVNIRKDLIKKIDSFILIRRESKNSQAIKRNPFLPYPKGADNNSDNDSVNSPDFSSLPPFASPAATILASPLITPSAPPAISPEISSTPGPDYVQ